MTTTACPTEDELKAYLVGNLAPTRLTVIGDHLDTCETCNQEKLAKLAVDVKTSDPLSLALLQTNLPAMMRVREPAEALIKEPEFRRAYSQVVRFVAGAAPGEVDPGATQSSLPPGLFPGDERRDTVHVDIEAIDYRRTTARSLDPADDESVTRTTEAVHIPKVIDRRTTAPVERMPGDEGTFGFLNLREIRNVIWPELPSAHSTRRWPLIVGVAAAALALVALIAWMFFKK